jgi:hypothetical protein
VKFWIVLSCGLLCGCPGRTKPMRPSVAAECMMVIGVDCTEKNADVIVTGEVIIREDGSGRLLRVTDVSPPDHPLRAEAVAAAEKPGQYSPEGTLETIVRSFPFCQRPFVDVIAGGTCPSRERIEKQMWDQGYRLRSLRNANRPAPSQ